MIGQIIARYEITDLIGEGGMATVYKAVDTQISRDVAIKFIRSDRVKSQSRDMLRKRFQREAKILAGLSHPHILPVLDYGEYNDQLFLVTPYMAGGSLRQRLGQPLPLEDALALVLPLTKALEYAHKQGIIHRDIKPGNILLSADGVPVIADFGIAKLLDIDEATQLTDSQVGVGTPGYMAPEQGLTKNVDQRADIYALGAVLYELLTGRKAYQGETPLAILLTQVNQPLPRPRSVLPLLANQIDRVILKAMAKQPASRYQTMQDFEQALLGLLRDQANATGRLVTKRNLMLGAGAIAAIAIVALFGTLISNGLIETTRLATPTNALPANTASGQTPTKDAPTPHPLRGTRTPEAIGSIEPSQFSTATADPVAPSTTPTTEATPTAGVAAPTSTSNAVHDDSAIFPGNVDRLAKLTRLYYPGQWFTGLVFSPNDRYFGWILNDGQLKVLNTQTSLFEGTFGGDYAVFGNQCAVAFNMDGSQLTVGCDASGTARLWEIASGRLLQQISFGRSEVALTNDGARLASLGSDGVAKVWDVRSGQLLSTLGTPVSGSHPGALAFSPNGKTLLIASMDHANLWNLDDGNLLGSKSIVEAKDPRVVFSEDGQKALVTGGGDAILWDISDSQVILNISRSAKDFFATLSLDGELVAISSNGQTELWAAALDQVSTSIPLVGTLTFSPDNQLLAISGQHETTLWSTIQGIKLASLGAGRQQTVFSPSGHFIAAGSGPLVYLWGVNP